LSHSIFILIILLIF